MALKLVVLDIDGTLLTSGERIRPDTAAWVAGLHHDGLQLALASARPSESIRVVREAIGVPMHIIGDNGAVTTHADGTLIRGVDFEVTPRLAGALAGLVTRGASAVNLYLSDGRWLAFGEDHRIDREEADTWMVAISRAATVAEHELLGLRVSKIMVDATDVGLVEQALADEPDLHITHSGYGLHDIRHSSSGKDNGLLALADALGLGMAEVLPVGDSDTDVPMLALAPVSLAVMPGSDAAREAASHVAHGAGSADVHRIIRELVDASLQPDQGV